MSCSDKIARWNVVGIQGAFFAKYIKPIYLESIVLGSKFHPTHFYRAIAGRLTNALEDLPEDYVLKQPYFESVSLIEIENVGAPASMDHGICWTDGYNDENEPEILNLHTGWTIREGRSVVSKHSFKNMFENINQKLPVRSDEGIEKFRKAKEKFFLAFKKNNFGSWEKGCIRM